MSSATSARWSMPLVYTALFLEGGKEGTQGGDQPLRVLAGDVVARLDLDELQARVGGLQLLEGLSGGENAEPPAPRKPRGRPFPGKKTQCGARTVREMQGGHP